MVVLTIRHAGNEHIVLLWNGTYIYEASEQQKTGSGKMPEETVMDQCNGPETWDPIREAS